MNDYQFQNLSTPSSSMILTMSQHQQPAEPILQQYRQPNNDAYPLLTLNQSMENDQNLELYQWNKTMFSLVINKTHYYFHYNDLVKNSIDESVLFQVIFYISYMLIFFIGITGNVLVCYVVFRQSSMHSVTNIFIANLAMSDILLCLSAVPVTPLYLLFFKKWIFGSLFCHLVPMIQGVSVYIAAFTLMSIAIERYSVIVHPFRRPITLPYCGLMILSIWLFAFILTLPYGLFIGVISPIQVVDSVSASSTGAVNVYEQLSNWTSIPESDPKHSEILKKLYCDEMWPSDNLHMMFGISTTIMQFAIPFCIITFCYMKVCSRLWDRIRTRPGNRNCSSQRIWLEKERARRTNTMLISMVVIFAVCWLPLNTYNLLEDFRIVMNWEHSRTLFILFHLVAMSSTCYNPFLYSWLNDNFRKEFKSIFVPICERMRLWIFKSVNQKDPSGHVVVALHRQSNNTGNNRRTGDTFNLINTNNYSLGTHSKDTKNSTKQTDLKMADSDDRNQNYNRANNNNNNSDFNGDDGEFISMTGLDTTTNLVTNVESINEAELQESLFATSMRNGICINNNNNKSGDNSTDSNNNHNHNNGNGNASTAQIMPVDSASTVPIVSNQL